MKLGNVPAVFQAVHFKGYTKALFYTHFKPFFFTTPCQFTPLLNLHPLIFCLMLFGWFISI
jgi:hypothetical protein